MMAQLFAHNDEYSQMNPLRAGIVQESSPQARMRYNTSKKGGMILARYEYFTASPIR